MCMCIQKNVHVHTGLHMYARVCHMYARVCLYTRRLVYAYTHRHACACLSVTCVRVRACVCVCVCERARVDECGQLKRVNTLKETRSLTVPGYIGLVCLCCVYMGVWCMLPSPTLSPTDPVPRSLLNLCPGQVLAHRAYIQPTYILYTAHVQPIYSLYLYVHISICMVFVGVP